MYLPKVIITTQSINAKQYLPENEVGLSTYDLALISINKINNKCKSSKNRDLSLEYLI